ncbi:serine/threonine-protein kinase S6KL [Lingula anatina]|uniref:Serine/threonine-protein kinase S6KL n=1 Tax=Lingula anatina TaxID=7574 RepID=A0A1S3H3V5_LINAN|nr:serine/threonine-protein kinase S6KL [Lingula anatina]|eukprot:XP_013379819.1 serine/threonine-protein kinase S6KL [Lingula anatina]
MMGNRQDKLNGDADDLHFTPFPRDALNRSFDSFNRLFPSRSSIRKRTRIQLSDELADHNEPMKDTWPVPLVEALFLPEFPVKGDVDENDFQILDVLGRGAFGNVLRVRLFEDKKIYAMKVLNKGKIMVDGDVQQTKDEVTIQNRLGHHPFLVKVHYFWQNKKNVYIVMDFASHGDLFSLWKHMGNHFSEDLIKIYVAEIALAIDFLNNAGVIYRDLKMENILLDELGHAKVTDFGLAKWLQRGQRTRTICGTLQYMAPEVLRMRPYTHAADWWTLGIMMYAMLDGNFPVSGAEDHKEMSALLMKWGHTFPDNFSIDAKNVLRGLLSMDQDVRTQNCDTLQKEPFFKGMEFEQVYDKQFVPSNHIPDWKEYENIVNPPLPPIEEVEFPNFEWNSEIQEAEPTFL